MKLDDACFVDYGTRVVRKKDGGTIYPVYGGGGATFQMDIYNRENCLVVARFAMSQTCTRFVQGKFFLNDSGLTLRAKDKDLSQQLLDWIIISKNDLISLMHSFCKLIDSDNVSAEYVTKILEELTKYNAEGRPIWKPMHMQPLYEKNDFISVEGDVSADIFDRGICLPSDNKMTPDQQDVVIEIIKRCFD